MIVRGHLILKTYLKQDVFETFLEMACGPDNVSEKCDTATRRSERRNDRNAVTSLTIILNALIL